MTDVSKELLPCPRCGNGAFITGTDSYQVWCRTDSCLRLPPRASRKDAIDDWNNRAQPAPDEPMLTAEEENELAARINANPLLQPAPADVVEKRVEEAIRQSYLGNPFAKHLFRRLAKAALASIPVSGEVERLREALGPLAAMRLSTEPTVSDCLYRSPATEARRGADEIEKRDADILRARQALKESSDAD
jgi:hypothetical protein